jgi:hypothetical protein
VGEGGGSMGRRSRTRSGSRERAVGEGGGSMGSRARLLGQELKNGAGRGMTELEIDELAEKVAEKVFKKKEEKEDMENEKKKREEMWEEGLEFLICKPCSENSKSPNVPPELFKSKSGRGGSYGIIGKLSEHGEELPRFELRGKMKRHCEGSLHKWCVREANKVHQASKTFKELNREAGLAVIMTYLKTARRGGSASDFPPRHRLPPPTWNHQVHQEQQSERVLRPQGRHLRGGDHRNAGAVQVGQGHGVLLHLGQGHRPAPLLHRPHDLLLQRRENILLPQQPCEDGRGRVRLQGHRQDGGGPPQGDPGTDEDTAGRQTSPLQVSLHSFLALDVFHVNRLHSLHLLQP